MIKKVKAYQIKYDTDDDQEIHDSLPQEIFFDNEFEDIEDIEERIADKISDETGWCVYSCCWDIVHTFEIKVESMYDKETVKQALKMMLEIGQNDACDTETDPEIDSDKHCICAADMTFQVK